MNRLVCYCKSLLFLLELETISTDLHVVEIYLLVHSGHTELVLCQGLSR